MVIFGTTRKAMKRWPQLSREDAQLCWKILKCPADEEPAYLSEIIRNKRYDALKVACKMALSEASFVKAFALGWKERDSTVVNLLVSVCTTGLYENEQKNLLAKLVNSDDWPSVMPQAFRVLNRVSASYLVGWICRMPEEDQPALFADLYKKRLNAYVEILVDAMKRDDAVFSVALAAMPDTPDDPTYMAQVANAYLGDNTTFAFGMFEQLMARGVYVGHNDGVLLKRALKSGRLDCAQALLDAGFDLRTLGSRVLEAVKADAVRPDAVRFLEEKMGVALPAAAKNMVVDGFHLLATDTVGRQLPLPEGGHLSIVFNFTLRQQIVVAHAAGDNKRPSAPVVLSFDAADMGESVQAAAQALIALGGDAARAADATRAGARQTLVKQQARG